jgi:hypothetical protein
MQLKKVNILYIGRHQEILDTVVRLLNKNEQWQGFGALTDEQAESIFLQNEMDIILLGPGIEPDSENNLCSLFKTQQPDIIILQHFGGGSGLLATEIGQALYIKSKKQQR